VPPLSADAVEETILREGPDSVAMFLAEPVIGVGGVIVPPDDYFPRVREICDRHEVLFAADEVILSPKRRGRAPIYSTRCARVLVSIRTSARFVGRD
jgi:adenosylmethionine-8-amino-7-oxononanoate aminotransferase